MSSVLGTLLMLIGGLGTPTGGRVLVAREDDTRMRLADVIASTRPLLLVHVVTAAVAGAAVFGVIQGHVDWIVLLLFDAYAVLMLAAYTRRELIHGLGLHRQAVNGEILTALVQLGLTIAVYLLGVLNLWTALAMLVVGVQVQVLRQVWILREYRGGTHDRFRRLVRFSLPAAATAVGQSFALRGDRLILGVMATSAAAGIYGSAASLSESLTLIAAGVGEVLFRRSSQGASRSDVARTVVVIAGITAVGAGVLALVAPWIIDLALGSAYGSALGPLRILCLATVPLGIYQVAVAGLNGSGRLGAASRVTMTGAACLALACFLLIPRWGSSGAAWSSVLAYAVMAVGALWSLDRKPAAGVPQPR